MMTHSDPAESLRSDEALMRLIARGDLDALGALYARHHQRIHALCYRLTGDSGAAEDLVQEAFLRVLKYAHSFEGAARFTTWLYRIVRNLCLDHMAIESREERRRHRLTVAIQPADDPAGEADERLDLVRRALYRLSPTKREVLVLSRFENRKYKEIAEILGISVDAVKARAHRAILDLRQIVQVLEREA